MDLADDLWNLAGEATPDTVEGGHYGRLARAIRQFPEPFVKILVEAGVLSIHGECNDGAPYYRVVQPHVHKWRVEDHQVSTYAVGLVCDCGKRESAKNRLPIEVPDGC